MLSDGEIADILSRDIPVAKTVEILVDRALKRVEEIILQLFYVRSWSSHAICSDEC